MTTDPQTDRIPITRSVSYAVRGAPEMPAHGAAVPGTTLAPTQVTFTYRDAPDSQLGRVQARVKGFWMRDGGRVNPGQPMAQHYFGDLADWPKWLAGEARLHDPEPAAVSVPPPTRAADQAALDNVRKLVRRLAAHAEGFGDVLDDSDRDPWAKTVRADIAALTESMNQAAEAPLSPDYEHPECGFHWHGRDGMDIPMRDGQPVCPRCELAKVQKQLDHSRRRREEVGEECKRRGRIKLEQAERIVCLERELDGVRDQLGKEMLRADGAEAELRRMAAEAQQKPDTQTHEDLPARLEAALTERFTELGNPFSEMRRHEQGPDGWPASHPVGPAKVAEVLRELLAVAPPAVGPGRVADEETTTQTQAQEPETEEQVIRDHVTRLHLIGEQLADLEFWMWEHLANVRDAERQQPETQAAHSCKNCLGIDPDTCLMNPERPRG